MFRTNLQTSSPALLIEEHFDSICSFLSPQDITNLSQTNSSLYNLYTSQQAWKSLVKAIFAPPVDISTARTSVEEEKSDYNTLNSLVDTSTTQTSKTEHRTPRMSQLRREILNSTLDPDEKIILQPLKSSVDFLLEKPFFGEKDLNEIKTLLLAKAEKFAQSTKKLEGLFILSTQHNQSLVSEINTMLELKTDFEDRLQTIETDSLKKLTDLVRSTVSKQSSAVREAYKEYMQKKRVTEHHKAELGEIMPIMTQVKQAFQACLIAGMEKYPKNINNILGYAGEIQEKAPGIAENFNHFLFNKLYDLLVTKLPEQKIGFEYVVGYYNNDVFRGKVKSIGEFTKNMSSKWEELSKQREAQKGKFSTRDNLLAKKVNHISDVLRMLCRTAEKLAKFKNVEPTSGSLRPIGGMDREKKLIKLSNMVSGPNVSFNIFDWSNALLWNELKEKVIREVTEMTADSERKEENIATPTPTTTLTTPQRPQVKVRVKKELGLSQTLGGEAFSKTTAGFFKSPTLKKPEVARPKSSYKENRKEITQEEEDYLQTTFHPGVKWKIL